MARKISFEEAPIEQGAEPPQPNYLRQSRPLLGLGMEPRVQGAVGLISRSLGDLTEKAKRADAIEQQLVQGLAVVELEPDQIDQSFVSDRMAANEEDFATFREAIRLRGQNSPILVRPAEAAGRYQVAFGHRRLRAARELGLKVKAVVRALSDEELVVAQGQENSARTDLTYIERARFAAKLEEKNFTREVIMQSLNVDKAALSKLIAIATRIPLALIEAIGPAQGFGRQRWAELAELIESEAARGRAQKLVMQDSFKALPSDKKFLQLYETLRPKTMRERAESWTAKDGTRAAQIQRNGRRVSLVFDERVAPAFGEYVKGQLQTLYDDFRKRNANSTQE